MSRHLGVTGSSLCHRPGETTADVLLCDCPQCLWMVLNESISTTHKIAVHFEIVCGQAVRQKRESAT